MSNWKRNNSLMKLADEELNNRGSNATFLKADGRSIKDSYNGLVAGFSVSVAMSGLCPALSAYFKSSDGDDSVNRLLILEVIARMIHRDGDTLPAFREIDSAKKLFRKAIDLAGNADASRKLQQEVIDCAIALKQVVRTYQLVES